jgi:hypothetical protein
MNEQVSRPSLWITPTPKARADLAALGRDIDAFWRRSRPGFVEELEAAGQLYDRLYEMQQRAQQARDRSLAAASGSRTTSSSKSMPRWAVSKSPALAWRASVKVPCPKPKSSAQSLVAVRAAPLIRQGTARLREPGIVGHADEPRSKVSRRRRPAGGRRDTPAGTPRRGRALRRRNSEARFPWPGKQAAPATRLRPAEAPGR